MSNQQLLPLVSVITPIYKAADRIELLRDAIRCFEAQTHPNIELIVVDDGSPDETVAKAEALLAASPLRTRIIALEQNSGPSVARNAGIDAADGTIVVFSDWDDLLLPGAIAAAVDAFQSDASRLVVIAPAYFYRELGSETKVYSLPIPGDINTIPFEAFCAYMVRHNFPAAMGSGVFCRKQLFADQPICKFDTFLSKQTAEDVLFGFRLLAQNVRPFFLAEPLVVHRGFLKAGSRGTDAFQKLDELTVQEYISAQATDGLIDRVRASDAQAGAELQTLRNKLHAAFAVKRKVSKGEWGGLLLELLAQPSRSRIALGYILSKYGTYLGLSELLLRRQFRRLPNEPAAKQQVTGLIEQLRS